MHSSTAGFHSGTVRFPQAGKHVSWFIKKAATASQLPLIGSSLQSEAIDNITFTEVSI